LAMATKDQAYGYFVLTFVYLIYFRWRSLLPLQRIALWRDSSLWQLFLGFFAAFILANNVLLNPTFFFKHVQNVLFVSKYGSVYQDFFDTRIALLSQICHGLVHNYGVAAIGIPLACLGLVSMFIWHRRIWILIVPVVSYILTFLFVVGYSFDRFVLGIAFVMNVAIGNTVSHCITRAKGITLGLSAVTGAFLLLSAFQLPVLLADDSRYGVENYLKKTRRSGDEIWVYSLGAEAFAPRIPASQDKIHYQTYEELGNGNIQNSVPPSANLVVFVYMFPLSSNPQSAGSETTRLLSQMQRPGSGYSLVYYGKSVDIFDPDSLPFVNPRIYVFRRI
jgi:hypothetical protein